ncbi:16S rRNA m(7)G-527 methyltransferase [Desulfosporosinus acidiphilus SJ4]|uniref:Ribosomal RNA small subunit methyltransferase G n=1 Tax=Desulfosporosinus acidiphilus (strain DSM 22704 / JCM 16185 / SJ4) TaxID=646529 RepID=I4DCM2_DESAJ|nr:16S rRNA (guanine(527)-N(7))-methyltransferase RsmG [Desulfosporosinus acidiphilus]AFM43546.1 16S rRNA m(7)G-527 methyltransferase [Desulfosporosinus acidiphilus SJ4]
MFKDYDSQMKVLTLAHLGYDLSEQQINKLCLFGDLLIEWNRKLNLTRITEPLEIILKHFIDSMVLGKYIKGTKFADLGTGAGFPGIPIKILLPELDVYLIDSLKKRLDFLDIVISELGLKNTWTIHARAEDIGRDAQYRAKFDSVGSRAVARLPVLLEFTLPILKKNGLFLSLKGLQAKDELEESKAALKVLGATVDSIQQYSFGESAEHRAVIVIKKEKDTPSIYPRKAGIPSKSPIH